ncbi:Gfo/Idh/MocA family oxidoreductase [Mycobacterium sp. 236(2023)]|uniref:Gfo/Idh/MocA family oxidoreductase n=1 Tax=Mycobacterium sp. 236(2023) TaxID=3038163 RepID=UPI002414EB23|nr:Gfo/Idh/MocA family oxidoreductase [Mycobacterium sp. 236(2023)]MDG4663154.1 Gfo/Idh/MocA family oxidoreductase [Mycobacterium sp. 236(2023)]
MRIGLVGYGVGGRYFHTPFIQAAKGCELVGVVARSAQRVAEVEADLPGMPVYGSLGALLDAGVDAVAISTPPQTRRELVLEAVGRGVHVVADKPFAPSAAAGRELVDAAEAAGVLLSVFHNRRWDTDITTLRGVLDSGGVGDVWRFDSRMDQDDPKTFEAGPEGGLLRDLGSHVVDQALWLLGPAVAVTANLDWVDAPEGRSDAGFVITISHVGGAHSHLSASKLNHVNSRELRLFGSRGSYVSTQQDVQVQAVFAGRLPADDPDHWGYEVEERWGVLSTADGTRAVPSEQGAYADYYARFAAAVAGAGPQPVPAAEAIATLAVLDAARRSAADGVTVTIG